MNAINTVAECAQSIRADAKYRPILFSGAMVRALLNDTKTQTRRVVKPKEGRIVGAGGLGLALEYTGRDSEGMDCFSTVPCPYGQPGDRLWVRETFDPIYPQDPSYNGGRPIEYDYAATYTHGDRLGDSLGIKKVWKPSIHMPRWASRITLAITGVRVERLQDISEADCIAEGAPGGHGSIPGYTYATLPKEHFHHIWTTINGPGSWAANPWLWVVEFKRVDGSAALSFNP